MAVEPEQQPGAGKPSNPSRSEQPAPDRDEVVVEAEQNPLEDEELEEIEIAPRQKPEIPGADLIPDIVSEGEQFLDAEAQAAAEADAEAQAAAREQEEADEHARPIADAAIDLAAGARYTATGKRKTAVARVIIKPGTGVYVINGKALDAFFPRETLRARDSPAARGRRLRVADGRGRADARRRCLGPGRSAPPRDLASADRGRPESARRAQAPRLPDARSSRQGAQEGRPEEGPQAAAVLQALRVSR